MKKLLVFATLIILYTISAKTIVVAWDDEVTHKDISEFAALQSSLDSTKGDYLRQIGINDIDEILLWNGHVCDDKTHRTNCNAVDWLKYGAEKEDASKSLPWQGRFQNHFHNPVNGEGLSDMQTETQMSSLNWAQDDAAQSDPGNPQGDQSWPTLRQLYYSALTTIDESERNARFAELFKGLGHQMHLVEDMAVPTHTRNNAHPLDSVQGSDDWPKIILIGKKKH